MGAQCLGKAAPLEDALKKKVLEITPRYLGSSEPQLSRKVSGGDVGDQRVALSGAHLVLPCPASWHCHRAPAKLRLGFGCLIPADFPGKGETRSSESAQVVERLEGPPG